MPFLTAITAKVQLVFSVSCTLRSGTPAQRAAPLAKQKTNKWGIYAVPRPRKRAGRRQLKATLPCRPLYQLTGRRAQHYKSKYLDTGMKSK